MLDCLVDSGASSNYISEAAFDLLRNSDSPTTMVFEPYQQSVIIADKTTIKSLGLLKVDLYVVDRTIRVPLIVLKNLFFDIILGMNFLSQNNVIIKVNSIKRS